MDLQVVYLEKDIMLSASRKRKLSDEKEKEVKYYAVRAGKEPGVYMTWAECQENITGFKGASCELLFAIPISSAACFLHLRIELR